MENKNIIHEWKNNLDLVINIYRITMCLVIGVYLLSVVVDFKYSNFTEFSMIVYFVLLPYATMQFDKIPFDVVENTRLLLSKGLRLVEDEDGKEYFELFTGNYSLLYLWKKGYRNWHTDNIYVSEIETVDVKENEFMGMFDVIEISDGESTIKYVTKDSTDITTKALMSQI